MYQDIRTELEFTRPAQITAHNQSASTRELEAMWAEEERAGQRLVNLAGASLALAIAAAFVWIALVCSPTFGTEPARAIPGAEVASVQHVL